MLAVRRNDLEAAQPASRRQQQRQNQEPAGDGVHRKHHLVNVVMIVVNSVLAITTLMIALFYSRPVIVLAIVCGVLVIYYSCEMCFRGESRIPEEGLPEGGETQKESVLTREERREVLRHVLKRKLYAEIGESEAGSSIHQRQSLKADEEAGTSMNQAEDHRRETIDKMSADTCSTIEVDTCMLTNNKENDFDTEGSLGLCCPICLNSYKEGDMMLVMIHCRHSFHEECLLQWLDKRDHCPNCRMNVTTRKQIRGMSNAILSKERYKEVFPAIDDDSIDGVSQCMEEGG